MLVSFSNFHHCGNKNVIESSIGQIIAIAKLACVPHSPSISAQNVSLKISISEGKNINTCRSRWVDT